MRIDDIINGIARALIGFFLGMALAYTFQLAQSAGWLYAAGWAFFLAVLFGLVLVFDRFLDWGFDKLTGLGIKTNRKKTEKPQRIVRFGWILGVMIGFGGVFLLPEGVQDWIMSS